jgi:hypothetical protein
LFWEYTDSSFPLCYSQGHFLRGKEGIQKKGSLFVKKSLESESVETGCFKERPARILFLQGSQGDVRARGDRQLKELRKKSRQKRVQEE